MLLLAAALPILYQGEDVAKFVKLPAPMVTFRNDVASATQAPWVGANGWHIQRARGQTFFYDVPSGGAALAMAEAYANDGAAVIKVVPEGRPAFDRMLAFLKGLQAAPLPRLADIAVTDDGSPQAGEALNLLARKNLLFRIVNAPDSHAVLNLSLTRKISDPLEFATTARQRLTDQRRWVKLYGSNVVLACLYGQGDRLRLHLLNYGRRPVDGLRVRIKGSYAKVTASVFEAGPEVKDLLTSPDATEFTLPSLPVYAVIELFSAPK